MERVHQLGRKNVPTSGPHVPIRGDEPAEGRDLMMLIKRTDTIEAIRRKKDKRQSTLRTSSTSSTGEEIDVTAVQTRQSPRQATAEIAPSRGFRSSTPLRPSSSGSTADGKEQEKEKDKQTQPSVATAEQENAPLWAHLSTEAHATRDVRRASVSTPCGKNSIGPMPPASEFPPAPIVTILKVDSTRGKKDTPVHAWGSSGDDISPTHEGLCSDNEKACTGDADITFSPGRRLPMEPFRNPSKMKPGGDSVVDKTSCRRRSGSHRPQRKSTPKSKRHGEVDSSAEKEGLSAAVEDENRFVNHWWARGRKGSRVWAIASDKSTWFFGR